MVGRIEVDLRDVLDGLADMERRGRDLRPLWKEIRPLLRQDLEDHFSTRASPEGQWAPPAQSTLERLARHRGNVRKRGKYKGMWTRKGARRAMNQLGRLKSAWNFRYDRDAIEATSKVSWAHVHQFGGSVGRGATVPMRTFAWVGDELTQHVADRVRDFVLEAW